VAQAILDDSESFNTLAEARKVGDLLARVAAAADARTLAAIERAAREAGTDVDRFFHLVGAVIVHLRSSR